MSGWAMVVIVAIIVWGVVEYAKARAGIITDEYGNEKVAPRDDARSAAELEAARAELANLKERVKVLERIATDANSSSSRLADEIERLRVQKDRA